MSRLYVAFTSFKDLLFSCLESESESENGEKLINSLDGSCGLGKPRRLLNGQ